MSGRTIEIFATASPREIAKEESSSGHRHPRATVLWTIFLLSVGIFSLCIATPAAIFYTAGALALFVLPGLFVIPIYYGNNPGTESEQAIIGAVFGIAISSYASIAAGFFFGWSPRILVLVLVGLSCACAGMGRAFRRQLPLPVRRWTETDYCILAVMGIVLVLFSASPALHAGKLTPHGYAYTWLYGYDLLGRSDYIAAMTTKLPPDWYWMTGVPLKMYLVGFALPAFAFAANGKAVDLHSVFLLITLYLSFLMLGCFYIFLRTLFSRTRVLLSATFVALFAYSYYWIYTAVRTLLMRPGMRFEFHDGVSHLFQRIFLVEPQAALVTSLLLVLLSVLAHLRFRLSDVSLAVFMAICLGISFGMDAMQTALAIAWFGLFYVGRFLLARGSLQNEYGPFAAAVVSCGLLCGSYFLLGMYNLRTSHLIRVDVNWWMMGLGLAFFPLEFGPLLLLGVWGVIRWWRRRREDFGWPVLLLGALALLESLLIAYTTVPRPRMVDRIWPVVLSVFAAYLFRELWSSPTERAARRLAVVIVLAAVPTFFTDVYFASNVDDVSNTRYVRVEDKEACDWIRQNLPETAVVQGAYNYFAGGPDRGLYLSLISSFAQRPQVLGWFSGAAVNVDDGWRIAEERRLDMDKLIGASQVSLVVRLVEKYSIDYLYVGPFEQWRNKNLVPLLQSTPDRFRVVYAQNGVSIFRYLADAQARAPGSPATSFTSAHGSRRGHSP